MYFTNKGLQKLKSEIDLVSIISNTVQLTRYGNGFTGKCPFCNYHRKTFVVSPEINKWYCLGHCNTQGTIIDWYMLIKNISVGRVLYSFLQMNISNFQNRVS